MLFFYKIFFCSLCWEEGSWLKGFFWGAEVLWFESAIVVQFLFNSCAGSLGPRALLGRGGSLELRAQLLCNCCGVRGRRRCV